jgi:hypothetical protein
MPKPRAIDTREAQAERVADFLEAHPEGSTLAEIDAACDLGSPTKVLSAMRLELGYGICRGPSRWVACVGGTKSRNVPTFILTHRPTPAAQLALPLE